MYFLPRIPAPVSLTAIAVVMLLSGPAPQAAEPARQAGGSGQADSPAEQDSPFFRLRRAVVEAAQARRWDDATAQARKLLDMTLPRGNPYEQLDASGLLYGLLYQQGQYAQAVLQTDQMMALAAADGYDPVSGQMQALIQRGLTAAMMAGDQGALARYLQELRQESKAFAPLWHWNTSEQQLHYQAAQLSVPLVQGRWVLVQLEPTRDRKDVASLEYVYLKPDGRRLRVRMRLGYDDGLKDMDAAARQKSLQQERSIFASERGYRPCRSATLCKASRPAARKEKRGGPTSCIWTGGWCAATGN